MEVSFLGGVMDIFKFHTPSGAGEDTHLIGGGEFVPNLLTIEWVDRYRDAGTITLTSRAEHGIREFLPEGTLVGLRGHPGVMMIEDHQLSDDDNAILNTTGRSLESFLENRIVRYNLEDGELNFNANPQWLTWVQAKSLIERQIIFETTGSDRIKYLEVVNDVQMDPDTATREGRKVARGELYSAVKTILEVDNIGWKIVRPGPWSPAADPSNNIALVLHSGVDRRYEITMSYESGDIENADYLWSVQKHKTQAIVYGKWITKSVGDPALRGLKRRVVYVDGKDIDEGQTTGTGWSELETVWISTAMLSRGKEALAVARKIALASVTPTKNAQAHIYGRDYDIGDIVTVRGNYSESRPMRVMEYVYIQDENGEFGYPTLEILRDDEILEEET